MLQYNKNYLQVKDYIYFFALSVFLVSTIFSATMWTYSLGDDFKLFLKITRYVAYIVCIIKIFLDKYYFNDFWKIAIILFFILIAGYFAAATHLFTYSFIFISSYGVEKKTLIKCVACIQFCLWLIIVFSSQIGLNVDHIFDAGTRNRHGLGFTWATTPAIMFLFILLEYMYIRKKKIKSIEYIVILIICYILYRFTDSRFTFLLSVMSTVCFWLLNNVNIIELVMKKMKIVWIMMPSLIAFFSYFIHRNYRPESWMWKKFNDLLSDRLRLGNSAIEKYGITLFGQKIEWITRGYQAREAMYNYVDCSYLKMLIQEGAIFLGICLIIYTYLLLKSIREEDYHLCGCILIVLVYCITEAFLLHLMYNPFPLLAVSYLSERKKE